MTSERPRTCTRCRRRRGTNPDCPSCDARRRAARARMANKRDDLKRQRLCECGDPVEAGYETCRICRGKARGRSRRHRLRQLPY